jgi:hypothetical protein
LLDELDRVEDEGCVVVLEEVTELDGLPLELVEVLKEMEEVEGDDCVLVVEDVEGLLLAVEVETTTLLVEEDWEDDVVDEPGNEVDGVDVLSEDEDGLLDVDVPEFAPDDELLVVEVEAGLELVLEVLVLTVELVLVEVVPGAPEVLLDVTEAAPEDEELVEVVAAEVVEEVDDGLLPEVVPVVVVEELDDVGTGLEEELESTVPVACQRHQHNSETDHTRSRGAWPGSCAVSVSIGESEGTLVIRRA